MSLCGKRLVLLTRGKAVPTKGGRVLIDNLVYIVIEADTPTELDEITAHTEAVIQPAGPVSGITTIKAKVVWIAD